MNILTAHGPLDRSLINRDRVTVDNDNERTLNLEYRLKAPLRLPDGRVVLPDEIVKRSAHVRLKRWPGGFDAELGGFMSSSFPRRSRAGRGVRPTGTQPDQMDRSLLRKLGHMFRFANTQGMCTSFKKEILCGSHAFGTQAANGVRTVTTKDAFKMALFLASASRSASDTVYNTTGELAGTGNYTQGGNAVTNANDPTTSGTTAIWTPSASVSWANLTSSGAFDAAVLWNDTSTSDLEVAVFTFGSQSITAGTFTLTMPTNDASNALIRIA
jgi:hypothetical protein